MSIFTTMLILYYSNLNIHSTYKISKFLIKLNIIFFLILNFSVPDINFVFNGKVYHPYKIV